MIFNFLRVRNACYALLVASLAYGPREPLLGASRHLDVETSDSKGPNNGANPWPFSEDPQSAKLYYIHVGKAGGIALEKQVGVANRRKYLDCHMGLSNTSCYVPQPKHSQIERQTYGHYHLWNPTFTDEQRAWLRNQTNLLLFTVRDPVDRIVSAFRYHHNEMFSKDGKTILPQYRKREKMYNECFPNVQALSDALSTRTRNDLSTCETMARQLVRGELAIEYGSHFHYNYQNYVNRVWSDRRKHVAVLRTEFLWKDVDRLEQLLGGSNETFASQVASNPKFSHGSERFTLHNGVSTTGARALCCHLISELEVYQELIQSAVNYSSTIGVSRCLLRRPSVGWMCSSWTEILALLTGGNGVKRFVAKATRLIWAWHDLAIQYRHQTRTTAVQLMLSCSIGIFSTAIRSFVVCCLE